jgi:hypothetical protein
VILPPLVFPGYLAVQLDESFLRRRIRAEVDGFDGSAPPATDPFHHLQRNFSEDRFHHWPETSFREYKQGRLTEVEG